MPPPRRTGRGRAGLAFLASTFFVSLLGFLSRLRFLRRGAAFFRRICGSLILLRRRFELHRLGGRAADAGFDHDRCRLRGRCGCSRLGLGCRLLFRPSRKSSMPPCGPGASGGGGTGASLLRPAWRRLRLPVPPRHGPASSAACAKPACFSGSGASKFASPRRDRLRTLLDRESERVIDGLEEALAGRRKVRLRVQRQARP